MRFPGFIGPSYTLASVNVDCQRCQNLFPEIDESGQGKAGEVASLAATPGLTLFSDLGTGPVRGLYQGSNNVTYAVAGSKLYSITSGGAATSRGTLFSTDGPVSMIDNGISLCVVDGLNGYTLILATNTFAQITDPDFLGADRVDYLDGYFVFNDPDSGKFYISGLFDANLDPLDFATAEGAPDNIVGLLCDHRELWLFGERSTEVWFNSGAADFPFERIQGAFLEHGCAAAASVAKLNNTVFWLGTDDRGSGIVWMARGYSPQRVSTQPIERVLQAALASNLSAATAFTYQQDGHGFYVLNVPGLESSWAYDVSTALWHERTYTASHGATPSRHRADNHAFAHGRHLVGDYSNGKVYELSTSVRTDDGAVITRRRTTPHLVNGLKRVRHSAFTLDMETGVGLDGSQQGDDPQVMLRWSDDGGHAWSNEYWRASGRIGAYTQRAIWRRLGASRDRVYDLTITDPVVTRLIGAELEVEAMAA